MRAHRVHCVPRSHGTNRHEPPPRTRSRNTTWHHSGIAGRRPLTRKPSYPEGHRGFESHPHRTTSQTLFVSVPGFRLDLVLQFTQGVTSNIVLMDGQDLALILEGQVSLNGALELKIQRGAQEGIIYLPLSQLSDDLTAGVNPSSRNSGRRLERVARLAGRALGSYSATGEYVGRLARLLVLAESGGPVSLLQMLVCLRNELLVHLRHELETLGRSLA